MAEKFQTLRRIPRSVYDNRVSCDHVVKLIFKLLKRDIILSLPYPRVFIAQKGGCGSLSWLSSSVPRVFDIYEYQ